MTALSGGSAAGPLSLTAQSMGVRKARSA